jgi:hypothetical protein
MCIYIALLLAVQEVATREEKNRELVSEEEIRKKEENRKMLQEDEEKNMRQQLEVYLS